MLIVLRSRGDDPVGAFIRYSIAVVVALALAVVISYFIVDIFIPGFEAKALWPPIAVVLFIPLAVIVIRIARKPGR